MAKRTYVIDGQSFEVEISPESSVDTPGRGAALASGQREVLVNGKRYAVQRGAAPVRHDSASAAAGAHVAAPRAVRAAAGDVRAPMAGRVVQVLAQAGQSVAAGAPLIVLDAMKMENIIHASRAGRVEDIAVGTGDTVLQGALLVRLA